MVEYINTHLSGFWIALGFALLAAEVLLFGFTTIIFLFSGLGAIITGLLIMSGILPASWIASVACFGISTGIFSALLWRPLQKMQNSGEPPKQPHSDFIGLEFSLPQDIDRSHPATFRYSGIDWQVVPASDATDQLSQGQRVQVTALEVGQFQVKAID